MRIDDVGGIRFSAPKDQGGAVQQDTSNKFNIVPPVGGWKKLEFVEQKGNTLTIKISGIKRRITDEPDIQIIGEELFHLSGELNKPENYIDGKSPILRLDFSNLIYMSSAILGKFITLNKKQRIPGSAPPKYAFELEGINSKIYEVFEITGLNNLFTIINPPARSPADHSSWGNGSGRGNLY